MSADKKENKKGQDKNKSDNILFESILKVNQVNKEGRKSNKVTRIECSNEQNNVTLDYNSSVYSLPLNQKFLLTIKKDDDDSEKMDIKKYEYVMNGIVWKVEKKDNGLITAIISFGGLLMSLSSSSQMQCNQKISALFVKT